jgi:hypothetical protein
MEVTVKLRLLLTSALFLFTQIPTIQAQETADITKITCLQLSTEQLARPSHEILVWLNGYYYGKRNATVISLQTAKGEQDKVDSYCLRHPEATVFDAMKNAVGSDK